MPTPTPVAINTERKRPGCSPASRLPTVSAALSTALEAIPKTTRQARVRVRQQAQAPRIESAKPASGAWMLSTRARPAPPLAKPCLAPGGADTQVPGAARTTSPPTVNATCPVEHEERVDVVVVLVWIDVEALVEPDLERRKMRLVAEDRDRPVVPLVPLAAAGPRRSAASSALRPPSWGGGTMSKRSRSPRIHARNPVLGAWKLSQRAVASLSLSNPWIRFGGTITNVPGARADDVEIRPDAKAHLALEHVEGVDVLEVDVRLRAAFARLRAGLACIEQLVLEEHAHAPTRAVDDRLAVVRCDQDRLHTRHPKTSRRSQGKGAIQSRG